MSDYVAFFKPIASGESAEKLIAGADTCLEGFTACFNARDRTGMDMHLFAISAFQCGAMSTTEDF